MTVPTPDVDLAARLFTTLRQQTTGAIGVTRDSYGAGEQAAHDLVAEVAADLGLERAVDPAGNQYVTLPGVDRGAPSTLVGSHLDSVPEGGNFDGAAGVVAGLAVLAGFRRDGVVPPTDTTVMAIRAEESAWFDVSYAGSSAALGLLGPGALDVRRSDTGRSLADHLVEDGFDPEWIRAGHRWLDPARIARFMEVHIEQGPVLEAEGVAVGIVTGIRGCLRHRTARAFGGYGHSGALPRHLRRDAVAATVELLTALDASWDRRLAAGEDLNVTVGELSTDPVLDGPSRVAGETRFVIDLRSLDDAPMFGVSDEVQALAAEIGDRRGVRFDLGARTHSPPARLDPAGIAELTRQAAGLGIATLQLASGAGHDSALFASQGIATNMIFIRNANGSHNPDEAMDLDDFALAAHLLAAAISRS
ncbi:Zn-dependent hydrolase [soil metagenome]